MNTEQLQFNEAISIKGFGNLVTFYFIADGSTKGDIPGYKVHSYEPESNFHLDTNYNDKVSFQHSDEINLPMWFSADVDLLEKLNNVILKRWK